MNFSHVAVSYVRGCVHHETAFVTRRDDDRARPLRGRDPVPPGAVLDTSDVAPDRPPGSALFPYTTLFRSRPGLSRTVPEEHASRGHQPDPGSEVRRCLGYRAHAQRDVVALRGCERPRIKVALVDVAGIRSEERRVGKECTRR